MECKRCGKSGAFNRVIVNHLTSTEIGGFCEHCEREKFGELLADPVWHQQNGCAFCDERSKYSLPELECLIEPDDSSSRLLEYEITDQTTSLCENHLRALLPAETTVGKKKLKV